MGIKEAIADFKKAAADPERFEVYMLGHCVGTATGWFYASAEELELVCYEEFYPRAPSGIFPIGEIVVDYEEGFVYMYEEKNNEIDIDYEHPVNIIEAIAKEL